jgi:hypothetical protein
MRMNMGWVATAVTKHIHPHRIHNDPSSGCIHFQLRREIPSVLSDESTEIPEAGRSSRQIIKRRIRRIAVISVLIAPLHARFIVVSEQRSHIGKIVVQIIEPARVDQTRRVDVRRKQSTYAHVRTG